MNINSGDITQLEFCIMHLCNNSPATRRWWRRKRKITSSAATSTTTTWWRWWRSSARTHIIIISSRWRHRSSTTTRRHSIKTPSSTHRKAYRTSPSIIKHHCEATIVICFVIEIGIVRLSPSFNWRLKQTNKKTIPPTQLGLSQLAYLINILNV